MLDVFEAFQALVRAESSTEFTAVPIGAGRNDFLAKTADGAPIFLVSDSSSATYTPGTTLKHLSVQFHATCRVQSLTGPIEGQFALITCDPSVPELYELFIRSVGAALAQLPEVANTQDIEVCVRSLLNLFRPINGPGGRAVAGLWAELFVILQSADISAAVRAWHVDTFERFDFSWPGGVLEVKATQGDIRIHEFSLEQLAAPLTGSGFVASLLLQPLTNGAGVMDLATKIDAALRCEYELQQRLWANMATSLGSEFGEKLDRRYDLTFAQRLVKVFNMTDVPAPERPSDPRVTGVRFRADLTSAVSTTSEPALKTLRRLFLVA